MARSRRSAGRHIGIEEQRLHQHVADLLARIERAIGVLEDDLHLAAHRLGHPGLDDIDRLAINEQFAGGLAVDEGEDAGERRFARARFADDGEGLALLEREADVLDGVDDAPGAEQRATDSVVADEIAGFENEGHQLTASSSGLNPVMVGRRSPVAFSGSAESSARV